MWTSDQIAKMFNVGPTFVTTGLVGMGTGTTAPPTNPCLDSTSGVSCQATPGPGQMMPYQCLDGTLVNATSMAQAQTMCASKAAAGGLGSDTMKYVLIGGAALVALLLLKK
jgi:hypothetical protein